MKTFLKILKYALYVIGVGAIIGFLVFFVLGIYNSCVADDIITAQNRIGGAYSFLWMIVCGLVALASLCSTLAIKETVYFDNFIANIKKLIKKDNKPAENAD